MCAATAPCASPRVRRHVSADPLDLVHSKLVVLWGANPTVSNIHLAPLVARAERDNDAALVVVDPRRTAVARRADLHLAVRPGTDVVLAYRRVESSSVRDCSRRDFSADHAAGTDEFLAAARSYSASAPRSSAESRSGTSSGSPRSSGRSGRGSCGSAGVRSGTATAGRRVSASWRCRSWPASSACRARRDRQPEQRDAAGLGRPRARHARGPASPPRFGMNTFGAALCDPALEPPISVLFVQGSDLAATNPDQQTVLRGLAREDLFTVVHDQVLTDTAGTWTSCSRRPPISRPTISRRVRRVRAPGAPGRHRARRREPIQQRGRGPARPAGWGTTSHASRSAATEVLSRCLRDDGTYDGVRVTRPSAARPCSSGTRSPPIPTAGHGSPPIRVSGVPRDVELVGRSPDRAASRPRPEDHQLDLRRVPTRRTRWCSSTPTTPRPAGLPTADSVVVRNDRARAATTATASTPICVLGSRPCRRARGAGLRGRSDGERAHRRPRCRTSPTACASTTRGSRSSPARPDPARPDPARPLARWARQSACRRTDGDEARGQRGGAETLG